MKSKIRAFDRVVGTRVTALSPSLRPVMIFFTWLGEPVVTVSIAAVVLGYGLALSKPWFLTAGAVAIVTIALGALLKIILRRARPANEYVQKMFFKTFSFPSGHATGSLVSYGLAAIVLSLRWPVLTFIAWPVAIIITLLVSLSRIFLGAHYASDIIGGWVLGVIGLVLIFFIAI